MFELDDYALDFSGYFSYLVSFGCRRTVRQDGQFDCKLQIMAFGQFYVPYNLGNMSRLGWEFSRQYFGLESMLYV